MKGRRFATDSAAFDQSMNRAVPSSSSRYQGLRRGRRTLALMAPLVQVGFFALGLGLFLEQSLPLLSDAQFTWGERRIMGMIALVALGGCGFAGWVVGRLIAVAAEVLDAVADTSDAAWRNTELMERQVVPALARIVAALEEAGQERNEPVRHRPAKP
jgi:hypothetical protein